MNHKFKKGDLVIHTMGSVHPYKELRGVVLMAGVGGHVVGSTIYRVFWYTIGSKQNIQEDCLKLLDNSLT